MKYEKPTAIVLDDTAEGIYCSSGSMEQKCDSVYMAGIWQGQDNTSWGSEQRGYKQQFGCLGCPANTGTGCGLLTHKIESGNAGSYDIDMGQRKPTWEKKGYLPDDVVTDWSM